MILYVPTTSATLSIFSVVDIEAIGWFVSTFGLALAQALAALSKPAGWPAPALGRAPVSLPFWVTPRSRCFPH
jgi:hypothetical protein